MSRPIVQRYAGPIAGLFVISILLLLLLLLVAAGSRGRWFARTVPITLTLPEEGAFGLSPGAEIRVLGIVAGNVDEIRIAGERILAEGSIRADLADMIRVNSPVQLKRSLLFSGDTFIDIARSDGTLFPDDEPIVLMAQADTGFDTLPLEVRDMLASITRSSDVMERFVARLEDPEGQLQQTLANTQALTLRLEELAASLEDSGESGVLHDLRDRVDRAVDALDNLVAVATEGVQTATDTVRTVEDQLSYIPPLAEESTQTIRLVQESLGDLRNIIRSLEGITATLGDELQDAPGVLIQVRSTLSELESLSRALRTSWLVTGPELGRERDSHEAPDDDAVDLIGIR